MLDHHQNNRAVVDLVRSDQLPDHVLFDRAYRRARFLGLLLMIFMMALSLYFFFGAQQLFERVWGQFATVEDSDAVRIRLYNQQIQSLQDRMTVFVADSVETKLKALEKNVTAGAVGAQEIKVLEELKGEVKLLENYSAGKGGKLTDLSRLDHARFQITPGTQNTVSSGDLLYEVLQLKSLLYLGIASCGLVGLMIGGYWWQTNTRVKRLSREIIPPLLLMGKSPEDL